MARVRCSMMNCQAKAASGLERRYADGHVEYSRYCPVHAHGANRLEGWDKTERDRGLIAVRRVRLVDIPMETGLRPRPAGIANRR